MLLEMHLTLEQIKIMNELLVVKKLCLNIKSQNDDEILKNISFNINRSEVLSLIGESGSGKSLTALSIIRLLEKSTSILAQIAKIDMVKQKIIESETISLLIPLLKHTNETVKINDTL